MVLNVREVLGQTSHSFFVHEAPDFPLTSVQAHRLESRPRQTLVDGPDPTLCVSGPREEDH